MTETTRTDVAAERVETLKEAIENLWNLRESDEGTYEVLEGLDVAINVLEVMKDVEYDRVKVQENITVKYSFTK